MYVVANVGLYDEETRNSAPGGLTTRTDFVIFLSSSRYVHAFRYARSVHACLTKQRLSVPFCPLLPCLFRTMFLTLLLLPPMTRKKERPINTEVPNGYFGGPRDVRRAGEF